ncbi:MAG: Bax inhibitor-1/YccA family protein [Syntrophobacteraceae bacterium]|nr:Bax inhibitor-1/YccA family protein [Syntrophobacteraceae bacterium]
MQESTVFNRDRTAVEIQSEFIRGVFNWMALGLAATAISALFVVDTGMVYSILRHPMLVILLVIGEVGIVIALTAAISRVSSATATLMFFGYAVLTGVTLSSIFLVYTKGSIVGTFFITGGTFAAMSAYGYVTKRDLTSIGGFLMMGLIGIIIASVVNIFLRSSAFDWLITYAGIAIFIGLTAYDTQSIKAMAYAGFAGSEDERKGAIIGALRLYLDFINLFLLLLRIFGRTRD